MCYSRDAAKSEFHRKLLECLTACFADVPELKKDATRALKLEERRRLLRLRPTGDETSPSGD